MCDTLPRVRAKWVPSVPYGCAMWSYRCVRCVRAAVGTPAKTATFHFQQFQRSIPLFVSVLPIQVYRCRFNVVTFPRSHIHQSIVVKHPSIPKSGRHSGRVRRCNSERIRANLVTGAKTSAT